MIYTLSCIGITSAKLNPCFLQATGRILLTTLLICSAHLHRASMLCLGDTNIWFQDDIWETSSLGFQAASQRLAIVRKSRRVFHDIIIIILKCRQFKAERQRNIHPISDPSPQYQPRDRQKRKGKIVEDYNTIINFIETRLQIIQLAQQ